MPEIRLPKKNSNQLNYNIINFKRLLITFIIMNIKTIILTVIFLGSLKIFAQQTTEQINLKIDSVVTSKIKADDPGFAVAIIKNGNVISKAARGMANLDYLIPVNYQTSFNIASNAKQYTAACILLLQKDNLISLDDDFRKYVPDVLKDYPQKIAIKNLLNHTSGIRDVYDLWALQGITWWERFVGNTDALNLLKGQTELNFKPNTKYLYSNSNYLLLAEIVKAVTKTSLKDYIKTKIFEPLQMTQTAFIDNYMQVISNRAEGYGNFGGWKKYPWITNVYGDGALFTTIDDQIKWEQHLFSPKLWDTKFNATFLLPIKTENQTFYGFGQMFDNYKGLKHTYHDGSTGAYNASFDRFPTENISVIVMSSNAQVWTRGLSLELAELVINRDKLSKPEKDLKETFTSKADLDILGDYQFEDGLIIKIKKDSTGLYREIYGRDPSKLKKQSTSIYAYEGNANLKMKFDNVNGQVKSLTIYAVNQEPQNAVKLETLQVEDKYYASLDGKYFNAETNTTIEIKYKDGLDYSLTKNGKTRNAKLIRKDYIGMNSYQVLADRNDNGELLGLLVNNNRITNVKFKRVD